MEKTEVAHREQLAHIPLQLDRDITGKLQTQRQQSIIKLPGKIINYIAVIHEKVNLIFQAVPSYPPSRG